jgi:hypothetical protein
VKGCEHFYDHLVLDKAAAPIARPVAAVPFKTETAVRSGRNFFHFERRN